MLRCMPGTRLLVSITLSGALLAGLSAGAHATNPSARRTREMASAARAFLATLSPQQLADANPPFADANREDWHFVPRARRGVPLGALTDEQRRAAHAVLAASLSSRGYLKATGVVALEQILHDLTVSAGRNADHRDPGRYYITVFGRPATAEAWGWRFEGHHVSLNFSAVTNDLVATTPAFLGANPAEVPTGPHAGWRLLAAEEDLARDLLGSLTPEQLASAVIAESAPADILFGPGSDPAAAPRVGLAASAMTPPQQAMLRRLIDEYARSFEHEIAAAQLDRIERAGLDAVTFAWAGPADRGVAGNRPGFYYRVHGPSFIIEYDNTQDGGNHAHAVWRDLTNDFGRDWLREHNRRQHGTGEPR